MKDRPLSKQKKDTKRKDFDPTPLVNRIEALMAEKNLSMREVGIESGLDHRVIRRLKEVHAKRPNMTYCILLADYFGVNPNEFLQLAGWPALKVFDIKRASIDNLPTEQWMSLWTLLKSPILAQESKSYPLRLVFR